MNVNVIILIIFLLIMGLMFLGMLVLMGFLLRFALKRRMYDKERGQKMRSVADEFGFNFTPQTEISTLPVFAEFELYEGNPLKLENLMTGTHHGNPVKIFDLVYRNYGGDHGSGTTTSRQTMVALESGKLNLPEFYLRPENIGAKILGSLSRLDIDFAERSDFSNKFLLYGKDERAIRQLFSAKLFDYFEKNPNTYIYGNKDHLFVYHSRNLIDPTQIAEWIKYTAFLSKSFQ